VRLRLTDDGRQVADRARPVIAACAKQLTAGLSDTEAEIVTRFLANVTHTFTERTTP
jgi:DNA-binding MarR family transcriptional regulator